MPAELYKLVDHLDHIRLSINFTNFTEHGGETMTDCTVETLQDDYSTWMGGSHV